MRQRLLVEPHSYAVVFVEGLHLKVLSGGVVLAAEGHEPRVREGVEAELIELTLATQESRTV